MLERKVLFSSGLRRKIKPKLKTLVVGHYMTFGEKGSSFNLWLSGIFAGYTSNCLRDRRPLVDYFMASGGIRKREINDFVVLLILYNSTYAILLLAWNQKRRNMLIKLRRKKRKVFYSRKKAINC